MSRHLRPSSTRSVLLQLGFARPRVNWEIPTSPARLSLLPLGIPGRLVANDVLLHLLLEFKGTGLMSVNQKVSRQIILTLVCYRLHFPLRLALICVMQAIKRSSDKHRKNYGHLTS